MRHLIFRMAVLGGLVAGVVVIPATMASAHAPFTAGPYSFAVGFGTEPAYVGIPNSIEVIIMKAGIGVTTAANSLNTTIAFGSARPISSDARMHSRRTMNTGSAPPSIIRANQ